MKASKQNFIIDILAFIFFVFLTSTGIIIHYLLPSGSGRSKTIWGFGRHDWGDLHFYVAVGFLLILAFHLFKHWKWIWSLVKGRVSGGIRPNSVKRALLGLVGLLAILILAVLPILSPVQISGYGETEHSKSGEQMENTQTIRGSMSLKDIENMTAVPITYILEKLKLPKTTPLDQKLKDIKDEYSFEVEEVRVLVSEYQTNK